ncbi:ATP-binding protein (plasmid) [Streptomyces sp. NBC_01426]|uniref:ATP-binding protein n=1 Tax=Streptomyces sp. NBC_01426 TaxID=2975866 RepID=UPI002E3265B5|nr:ATP-binding protein [Streptomyces sp. NBC_01426]
MGNTSGRPVDLTCEDARAIAHEVLAAADVGERLMDDVLLVVSELVSNAVRHAGGVTDFHVRPLLDSVAVAVSDASSLPPHMPGTPVEVPGGFGWLLVNKIANRTEIRPHDTGKTVTAFIQLPPVEPSSWSGLDFGVPKACAGRTPRCE